jgi:hypothetical protein
MGTRHSFSSHGVIFEVDERGTCLNDGVTTIAMIL